MRFLKFQLVALLAVSSVAFADILPVGPQLREASLLTGWEGALAATETLPHNLTLPGSYTLEPNYVTPVKNQGSCGSCWAFATYGSVESNILVQGGSEDNLSENHLINNHGFEFGPDDGGQIWMSAAYLSRLDGPVSEADDPYPDGYGGEGSTITPGGYERQYFLHDMPIYDTSTEIKNGLMSDGGLYTSMYYNPGYYNSSDYTYYYDGGAGTNHGVTIVGWDDSKVTAGGTGAWRCKNSWADTWGDSGYFWISYDDTKGGKYGASFQAASPDPADNIVDVYQHDDFGRVSVLNPNYALNYFETQGWEPLGAVGFYTYADDADYDVRIYDTFSGASGGSDLLAQVTGTIDYQGWHVVDLDPYVALLDNDFAVYLYLDNAGDYYQAFEYTVADYCTSTSEAGQSYYSFDGSNWSDLYAWNDTANFSIKAYATPEPATVALFALGLVGLGTRLRRRQARWDPGQGRPSYRS